MAEQHYAGDGGANQGCGFLIVAAALIVLAIGVGIVFRLDVFTIVLAIAAGFGVYAVLTWLGRR